MRENIILKCTECGEENYIKLLDTWYVQLILHAIVIINAYFLMTGEKYYNEDVGVE